MQKLVIFLNPNDLNFPNWAVVDDNGAILDQGYHDDLQSIALQAEERAVIVLVPAEDVLLTSVNLPKLSKNKVRQALPFALEEQLVADLDTLHFAIGERKADQVLPVAVVANEKMASWLDFLNTAQITPQQMIPSTYALATEESSWTALITPDKAVLRLDRIQGFGCDTINFKDMLNITLAAQSVPPGCIRIYNCTQVPIKSTISSSILLEETIVSSNEMMSCFNDLHKTPINLLQGKFGLKQNRLNINPKLRKLAFQLLGVLAALIIIYPLVSHAILNSAIQRMRDEVVLIYKANFPQATQIIAPKLRMQQKLENVTANKNQKGVLPLLNGVGSATNSSDVVVKQLNYDNNALTLEVIANSSDALSGFMQNLQQQGFKVKQQTANLSESKVTAKLLVE